MGERKSQETGQKHPSRDQQELKVDKMEEGVEIMKNTCEKNTCESKHLESGTVLCRGGQFLTIQSPWA